MGSCLSPEIPLTLQEQLTRYYDSKYGRYLLYYNFGQYRFVISFTKKEYSRMDVYYKINDKYHELSADIDEHHELYPYVDVRERVVSGVFASFSFSVLYPKIQFLKLLNEPVLFDVFTFFGVRLS